MGNDTITITLPTDTISYDSTYNYISPYFSTSSITDTITISSLPSYTGYNASTITFDDTWFNNYPTTTPFVDGFPDWNDFENMCKEYPALEKSFENLKTIHKLCEAEWEGKKREEDGNY